MAYIAKNNATSTLAGAINSAALTLTVQTGHGDRFPVITAPDYTYLTLEDTNGNIEIIKITARVLGSDSMTIERAQFGGSARDWLAGDLIECRQIANLIQDTINHMSQTSGAHAATGISTTAAGNLSATNVQAAINELDDEKLGLATGGTVSGDVNFTGAITLDGAAGTAGQVMVSSGTGTPVWGNPAPDFSTQTTGAGDLIVDAGNVAISRILNETYGGAVDYTVEGSSEYESGLGTIYDWRTDATEWTDAAGNSSGAYNDDVATDGTLMVAVGSNGRIRTSTDGNTWTVRNSGTRNDLYGVTYAAGLWVVTGGYGTILTSTNGINWTLRSDLARQGSGCVLTDGTTVVVMGGYGTSAYSTDGGVTFAKRTQPFQAAYFGCHDGESFWAYGLVESSPNKFGMYRSVDGLRWVEVRSEYTTFLPETQYAQMVKTATQFVVTSGGTGAAAGTQCYVSSDGVTWTAGGPGVMSGCAFNGSNLFIAVPAGSTTWYYSSDGTTWNTTTGPSSAVGTAYIQYVNGYFFVHRGGTTSAWTSPDGTTWTARTLSYAADAIVKLIYAGSTYVAQVYTPAGGAYTAGTVLTSTNLSSWTTRSTQPATMIMYNLIAVGSSLVAVGTAYESTSAAATGALALSTDYGVSWTDKTSVFGFRHLYRVAYSAGIDRWVAVSGGKSCVYTSDDGESWVRGSMNVGNIAFNGIAASDTLFVAVGNSGNIYTSTNGTSWTSRTALGAAAFSGSTLLCVTRSASRWLITGASGKAAYSDDPEVSYTASTVGMSTNDLYCYYDGTKFFACGGNGSLAESSDAITWTSRVAGHPWGAVNDASFKSVLKVGSRWHLAAQIPSFQAYSDDAINWYKQPKMLAAQYIYALAHDGGANRLAVGNLGRVYTSGDSGDTWTLRATPFSTSDQIACAIWASTVSKWVIAGYSGKLYTSPDGISWTVNASAATAAGSTNITNLLYTGASYVLITTGGYVGTASDPAGTWTARGQVVAATAEYNTAATNGSGTVLIDCGSSYYRSTDHGASWAVGTNPTGYDQPKVCAYYDNKFHLFFRLTTPSPYRYYLFWSTDGSTWTINESLTEWAYFDGSSYPPVGHGKCGDLYWQANSSRLYTASVYGGYAGVQQTTNGYNLRVRRLDFIGGKYVGWYANYSGVASGAVGDRVIVLTRDSAEESTTGDVMDFTDVSKRVYLSPSFKFLVP